MLGKMIKSIVVCLIVLFATSAYADIFVYDPGTDAGIQTAMTNLGYTYTVKTSGDPLTATDLANGDILVIGWNMNGDMSGLDSSIWGSITGNVLLTGHDADYHAWAVTGTVGTAASTFLDQAVTFAQATGGVGLVALGDASTAFGYLPAGWGISATGGLLLDDISSFTPEGIASGVYAGLTPALMSNWFNSYHTSFDSWGSGFVSFELGNNDADVVTIAHVVPVPGAVLLGMLGLGVAGLGLGMRRFA